MELNDTLGLAMMGLMHDDIMRKLVATQMLTDNNKNNDLLGVALLRPGMMGNPAISTAGLIVGSTR